MLSKNFKLTFLIGFLFLIKICFAQFQLWGGYELALENFSTVDITVTVIPVSMIMTQTTDAGGNFQYTLEAANKGGNCLQNQPPEIDYDATANSDCSNPHSTYSLVPNTTPNVFFNFDNDPPTTSQGQFCYGIYKIIAKWYDNGDHYDTCWYEQDAGANYDCGFMFVDHVENFPYGRLPAIRSGRGWTYSIMQIDDNWGPQIDIAYTNYYLQCWRPYFWDPNRPSRPKEMGNFHYGIPSGNGHINYTVIPLDARLDCNNPGLPIEDHDYSLDHANTENGNLSLNLTIDKSISTSRPDSNWLSYCQIEVPNPYCITILPGANLSLSNNIYLTLADAPNWFKGCSMWNNQKPAFLMTVKTGATLNLGQNTQININNDTKVVLECNSNLYCSTNGGNPSIINVNNGGIYCNQGANKTGKLNVIYNGRGRICASPCPLFPFYFGDSTTVILDSGAVLQIPDNTNIVFDGSNANLEMSPTSSIQFGQNSKLTLQNGAHICAQNCNFQSDSTGNPWDGIYLSGGCDTIINCTITNSYNGLNILNKNGNIGFNPITTQITGCTFQNTTNTQLSTGINIYNSNNLLINKNSFSSSPLTEGWASAILMQYCPAGDLDILDNTIKNVTNGFSIIQSSPYIERNIINGQTDGTGIILDCCNGTLKYNTVNNFSEALVTYYSSDYFFRNNLNYSANNIVDLYQSSAPIVKPIYSGSALMWFGGNNFLNGNSQGPSGYGIGLNDGSLPAIDSGFNNIVLNGPNYMSGDLSQTGVLPATYNFWQDRPPVYSKFVVTNGYVIDTPDYDGSSLPPINGYQLADIGFGYYDTVCTSGSSNSPGADNLYIQAYSNEVSHNYAAAVNLYKQLVSTYKTSNLVPAALSRIINCMEKKTSTTTEYSQLQNYMLQIRNNNQISYTVREIAEDFIIKSMVRQNLYNYSINDYDSMYVHNQGNHKGTHALINKLSILSFYRDTTGNHVNTPGSSNQYKLSLLSLLTGKQLSQSQVNNIPVIPKEFKLYQNYPNPFNPSTKIKYDMPKEGLVKIKIYDIVGREIYSFEEFKAAGSYELQFDGSKYASGVYFYRIESTSGGKDFVAVKKMVLIK